MAQHKETDLGLQRPHRTLPSKSSRPAAHVRFACNDQQPTGTEQENRKQQSVQRAQQPYRNKGGVGVTHACTHQTELVGAPRDLDLQLRAVGVRAQPG